MTAPITSTRSLTMHFLIISCVILLVALSLVWLGLLYLFERHVERRMNQELHNHIQQLAANIIIDKKGKISLSGALADPRFTRAFSGLYWQIASLDRKYILHSPSLWDFTLALPHDRLKAGKLHRHLLPGPQGSQLHVLERPLQFQYGQGTVQQIRIATAIDKVELVRARSDFSNDLALSLLLIGSLLFTVSAFQVYYGLKPLESIRKNVEKIRNGSAKRIEGSIPKEIATIAEEVNALLVAQEKVVERTRNQASDLAHGLKTPLTVLKSKARQLREAGQLETGNDLDELANDMTRHVEHVLARSRISPQKRGQKPLQIAPIITRLVHVIQNIPDDKKLQWEMHIDATHTARIDKQDLTELLGNILENAKKWATENVNISSACQEDRLTITVSDDGPGLSQKQMRVLGARGKRFDETIPGTGIGLAIAIDIIEAYDGSIDFYSSDGKGLTVVLQLKE